MKYSIDIEKSIDALLYCLNKVNNGINEIWDWDIRINAGGIDYGIYFNFDTDNNTLEICNSPDGEDNLTLDDIITLINEEEEFYKGEEEFYANH